MARSLTDGIPPPAPTRSGQWADVVRVGVGYAARRLPAFRGKGQLCSWVDRRLRRSSSERLFDLDGVRFVLNTAELNDFRLLYGLDRGVSDYLVDLVNEAGDAVVWDVGANVGAVSLALAARCPRARVVAIEASPAVGQRLARNVAANPDLVRRIQIVHAALGDVTGMTPFYESAEAFNSGVGRIHAAGNTLTEPRSVPIYRGDDLIGLGQAPAPDIIKIDIEGFEEPAVRGLISHLSARGPQLVFEHEPYRLASAGNPPSPVPLLREFGYSIRELTGNRLGQPVSDPPQTHCDLVARREPAFA